MKLYRCDRPRCGFTSDEYGIFTAHMRLWHNIPNLTIEEEP